MFAAAGASLRLTGVSNNAIQYQGGATVKLTEDRKHDTLTVISDLRKQLSKIPGARVRLNQYDVVSNLMTGGNLNVEVDIFGDDLDTLSGIAQEMIQKVRPIAGFESVDVNWQAATPEIQWQVDRDKASQLGVTFADVANAINTATNGDIASYYQERGFQYPIIVQMPERSRKTIGEMQTMPVSPSLGGSNMNITLGQVAKPIYSMGPSQITRQDRQRYIAVTGTPQGRSAGEIQADIQKAIAEVKLPTGYYWDWGTNQKRRAEEFSGLGLAVLLAIGLIYMLLASQFESLIHPLTILLSVPLAATGVILSLFLTGRSFGLTAFIGVLMLVGIVVKNGILLVDYTNHLRRGGMEREQALLTAGPTRLRPILMTASAAVLGMLPLALGLARGQEIQAPMATAVIGGLTTSTFLTLLVVPCAYSVLDELSGGTRRERRERAAREREAEGSRARLSGRGWRGRGLLGPTPPFAALGTPPGAEGLGEGGGARQQAEMK